MQDAARPQYDVAFSFLTVDEALARQFADALKPLVCFVYSREQEDLAGTDGLVSFREAFRDKSRLNVTLFRAGWGDSRVTRIEETAIEERIHADGWDSVLVVRRDASPKRRWMPDMRIYFELETYPFDQCVGAIKRQAERLGAVVRPLTGLERAQGEADAAAYDGETRQLFESDRGVREGVASCRGFSFLRSGKGRRRPPGRKPAPARRAMSPKGSLASQPLLARFCDHPALHPRWVHQKLPGGRFPHGVHRREPVTGAVVQVIAEGGFAGESVPQQGKGFGDRKPFRVGA